ncbi:uncharacterized protein LOC143574865 [Bidens hawaiensis]|uniref:uncharacterized protein LOC143574865 n=1 Tax=Bidens hawaiensis TaxID=980011 RepID=UPI00404A8239
MYDRTTTQAPPEQGQVWSLFTDGASSSEGSSAGLRLVNPEGHEFTYAIKLDFKSTNNEAEYEAFLAGLRIAKKLGSKYLEAWVDSMLIAGQINGTYEAKNDVMASYLSQAKRSEKKSADALSKLASTNFEHFAKDIRVEVLDHPSVHQNQVLVIQIGVESWMTPIKAYLSSGALPAGKAAARKIKHKALNYQMTDGILYRISFLSPLLRCVDAEDANYLIREIHEGICGLHAGPRMTVAKIMNAGYYWPGMHLDALVSDNGTQFADSGLQEWLRELQVTQVFTSVAHPQANGQVERTNRTIKEGIKARLGTKQNGWVDELPHVLWALRTQKNSSNSETPFSLTYGTEAMILAEIGIPSARVLLIKDNDRELRMNLDLLEKRQELASIREHNYKRQLQKYYKSRVQICEFDAGDFVFRNNEASEQEPPGNLAPTWEGPYKIKQVLSKGAYKLEKLDGTEIPRMWNAAQLRKCYM